MKKYEILKEYIFINTFIGSFSDYNKPFNLYHNIISNINDITKYTGLESLDEFTIVESYTHAPVELNFSDLLFMFPYGSNFFVCHIDDDYDINIADIIISDGMIVLYKGLYKLDIGTSLYYEKIKNERGELRKMKDNLSKLTENIIKNSFMETFATGSHIEIDIINNDNYLNSYFDVKLLDDFEVYIHLSNTKIKDEKKFKLEIDNPLILIKYNNKDFFLCKIDDEYNIEIIDIIFNHKKIVTYTKEHTGYKLDFTNSILYEKIKKNERSEIICL